jgi:hypothetical protein
VSGGELGRHLLVKQAEKEQWESLEENGKTLFG